MPFHTCENCGQKADYPAEIVGTLGKCPSCSHSQWLGGFVRQQPTVIINNQGISNGAAAACSLLIPGLGQTMKGQVAKGLFFLVGAIIGYMLFIIPGMLVHIVAIADAATT